MLNKNTVLKITKHRNWNKLKILWYIGWRLQKTLMRKKNSQTYVHAKRILLYKNDIATDKNKRKHQKFLKCSQQKFGINATSSYKFQTSWTIRSSAED